MIYLGEHQMGFDPNCIAFPSISGCHAIVYQTSAGLFGYHNAGGSADRDFQPRGNEFSNYVRSVTGVTLGTGTRLYGATYAGINGRGWSNAATEKTAMVKWKEELVAFATALTYTGRISGYDLSKLNGDRTKTDYSAYCEFRKNGDKCDLYIRAWSHGDDALVTTGANTDANQQTISGSSTRGYSRSTTGSAITGVGPGALTHVSKQRLR